MAVYWADSKQLTAHGEKRINASWYDLLVAFVAHQQTARLDFDGGSRCSHIDEPYTRNTIKCVYKVTCVALRYIGGQTKSTTCPSGIVSILSASTRALAANQSVMVGSRTTLEGFAPAS
ncbi:hypothetical protein M404DRAFT_999063, partial [Pisolithus tinctorius Marx 270]